MARKVNTTFQGSTEAQCAVGSHMLSTVVGNAVGDTCLTHDMITGQNSPPDLITHEGGGTGAPLGVAMGGNGAVFPNAYVTRCSTHSTTATAAYIMAHPVFLPRGESSIIVDFVVTDPDGVSIQVRDTSWSLQETSSTVHGTARVRGESRNLTGGSIYFVMAKCDIGPIEKVRTWSGWSVHFGRMGTGPVMAPAESSLGRTYPVDTTTTGGATIMSATAWDSAAFATDFAFHAQLSTRLNRMQNALAEMMTGAQAGGNGSYSIVSSTGTDPTSSAFHDHSLSTYTGEGAIDFPVLSHSLGAVDISTVSSSQRTSNWGAPSQTTASKVLLVENVCWLPDFPDGVSTSRLRCAVLCAVPTGSSAASVDIYAQTRTTAGGLLTERTAALTACGTSRFYYVVIGNKTGSSNRIDFAAGESNAIRITVQDDTAGDPAMFMGYCWYFDGS